MKKGLLAILALAVALTGFTQNEKYTNAMKVNLGKFDSVKTADEMLAVSASFERIAEAEKTQWLPYYYAALAEIFHAFMKNDAASNDNFADKAEQLITKAEIISPNNSEITCLKSWNATLRMIVNPSVRWQQYGTVINSELEKAKKLDPSNPRPYYLQGANLRNTPENFGGGCAPAKPLLEEAMKKYEAFKPASELHPVWGKDQVQQMLAGCK